MSHLSPIVTFFEMTAVGDIRVGFFFLSNILLANITKTCRGFSRNITCLPFFGCRIPCRLFLHKMIPASDLETRSTALSPSYQQKERSQGFASVMEAMPLIFLSLSPSLSYCTFRLDSIDFISKSNKW